MALSKSLETLKITFFHWFVFEKFFDGLYGDLCCRLVWKMKLTRGNTAERHAFQIVFRCQFQAGR